jgi:hypothetical protein
MSSSLSDPEKWAIAWERLRRYVAREENRLEKAYEADPHGVSPAMEAIEQVREAMDRYEPRPHLTCSTKDPRRHTGARPT